MNSTIYSVKNDGHENTHWFQSSYSPTMPKCFDSCTGRGSLPNAGKTRVEAIATMDLFFNCCRMDGYSDLSDCKVSWGETHALEKKIFIGMGLVCTDRFMQFPAVEPFFLDSVSWRKHQLLLGFLVYVRRLGISTAGYHDDCTGIRGPMGSMVDKEIPAGYNFTIVCNQNL